jgi:hypothetical protein
MPENVGKSLARERLVQEKIYRRLCHRRDSRGSARCPRRPPGIVPGPHHPQISMSPRGNPYDAFAERFMRTLKEE